MQAARDVPPEAGPAELRHLVERRGGFVGCISQATVKGLRAFDKEDLAHELGNALDLQPAVLAEIRRAENLNKVEEGCRLVVCEQEISREEQQIVQTTLVGVCLQGTCGSISGELILDGNVEKPPTDHLVSVEGRSFSVLPWRACDDTNVGNDMVKDFDDNWVDIPNGWRPYEICKDFDRLVLPKVIAGNCWGTDMVIVRRGQKWPAWKTGIQGPASAGRRLSSHVEWFEMDHARNRCVFRAEDTQRAPSKKLDPLWRSWNGRVLLERIPHEEQQHAFKAFLYRSACETWCA